VQVLDRIDREQIDGLRERGEYFWLDLVGAGEEELTELQRVFELHALVIEDMRERPASEARRLSGIRPARLLRRLARRPRGAPHRGGVRDQR
jgi:hypothetical protein